ncbi:hypothetical protein GCM10023149_33440 [Mucilaginibacter gynuensis]|uniref:Uncharacterized protein n=1 Tax=Mucilaginibacter gynuensis TaxID=1302236 RepID=A0ABP8GS77_9SPHI
MISEKDILDKAGKIYLGKQKIATSQLPIILAEIAALKILSVKSSIMYTFFLVTNNFRPRQQ